MPLRDYQRHLFEAAERRRRESFSDRHGVVHEVWGDKIRVEVGKDREGKPVLSPWLHTTNMRGGARERRRFEPGQTVRVSAPGGDMRAATVTHWAENEQYNAPNHADDAGHDSETYQQGGLRSTKTDDTIEHWLGENDREQDQGAQGGQGGQQQQSGQKKKSPGTPKIITRMNESGGITHREVSSNARIAVHKDGVKMRVKDHFMVITKQGQIIFSKPPILEKDPIPNDDKHVTGKKSERVTRKQQGS